MAGCCTRWERAALPGYNWPISTTLTLPLRCDTNFNMFRVQGSGCTERRVRSAVRSKSEAGIFCSPRSHPSEPLKQVLSRLQPWRCAPRRIARVYQHVEPVLRRGVTKRRGEGCWDHKRLDPREILEIGGVVVVARHDCGVLTRSYFRHELEQFSTRTLVHRRVPITLGVEAIREEDHDASVNGSASSIHGPNITGRQ